MLVEDDGEKNWSLLRRWSVKRMQSTMNSDRKCKEMLIRNALEEMNETVEEMMLRLYIPTLSPRRAARSSRASRIAGTITDHPRVSSCRSLSLNSGQAFVCSSDRV